MRWSYSSPNLCWRQAASNTQESTSKPATPLTLMRRAIRLSKSNLTTRNWFHSLTSQRFQALLTLFSKSFSPFPHGTCLLSVSRRYLALGENYLPICAPVPKYATLRKQAVDKVLWRHTGFSPSLMLSSNKTYAKHLTRLCFSRLQFNAGRRFTFWAFPGSFAITKGIIFIFFSSAYLYA